MLEFVNEKQDRKLDELRNKEAETLAETMATRYGLPYIDLSKFPINTDALRLIPETEAKLGELAAFKSTGKELFLAIHSPNQISTQRIIEELRGKNYHLNIYLSSLASLQRAWQRYSEVSDSSRTEAGVIDIASDEIVSLLSSLKNLKDVTARFASAGVSASGSTGISSVLEIILAGAIKIGASDIHLEPEETGVRLRYRLDGVLHDIADFGKPIYQQIISRIKLISGLKLNVKKAAQDGRFTIRLPADEVGLPEVQIEIRTSLLPGAYGESLVMRVLDPETITLPLEALGIEAGLLTILEAEIAKPNGMILLTGPTGSGKTTTLYACLQKINSSEAKIITIEDPIEYHLKGINQTQVGRDKDYTFLTGLRAALRQDPDVIMVGEIRDAETAKIALNAALTGHLLFSTLHTNNAWGTIPRLIDLGINAKVIDAALNLSVAQRLVRKLCDHCKVASDIEPAEKVMIDNALASIKKKRPELVSAPTTKIYHSAGCDNCQGTGYRGRIGIFEAVRTDAKITALLDKNPNERELKLASQSQGILEMREDGILKVLAGVTSLPELGRVIDLGNSANGL